MFLHADIQRMQPPDDGKLMEDLYGSSLALGADWGVVGAPDDTCGISDGSIGDSGYRSGSIYLFHRVANAWTYKAKMRGPALRKNRRFGQAIALQGSTLAVASNLHPTQNGASAVHVYELSGDSWVLQQELPLTGEVQTAPVLALDGDRLLIANPDTGAVHAFERSGQTWDSKGNLAERMTATAGSNFGTSLALSGSRAFVGAPGHGLLPGAVHEFGYVEGLWTYLRTIATPAGNMYDQFGKTLVFQNGFLLVGARIPSALKATQSAFTTAGRVYVFSEGAPGWELVRTLERPQGVIAQEWGASLTSGSNRVIIGANIKGGGQGSAAFQSLEMTGSDAATWPLLPLPIPTGSSRWMHGSALASFGSMFWRGGGMTGIAAGVTSTEHVDTLSINQSSWTSSGMLQNPPSSQLQMGEQNLIAAGDDLIVGSPDWKTNGWKAGMVHVFAPAGGQWPLKQTIYAPAPNRFSGFGYFLAWSKETDRLAIGTISRTIYFYERSADQTWTLRTSFELSEFTPLMGMKWDRDILYFATWAPHGTYKLISRALQFSSGEVTELTSRQIDNIDPNSFNATNDQMHYFDSAAKLGQPLIIQRYTGQSWRRAQTLSVPASAESGKVWSISPEQLVLTTNHSLPISESPIFTSMFKGGLWQPLKRVMLPKSYPSDHIKSVTQKDNVILVAVTRGISTTTTDGNFPDTALIVKTASGDWRFLRWLGFPSRERWESPDVAISGSHAARLSYEYEDRPEYLVPGHVEVQKLGGMDVHEGPVMESTRLPSATTLDWGGTVLVGQKISRVFTLKNSGGSSYAVEAAVDGIHAADFQVSGMPAGVMNPGDEAVITVTVKATATGMRTTRLTLTPTTTDVPAWTLDLNASGADTVTAPAALRSAQHVILARGTAWTGKPAFEATHPAQIEWRKNGKLFQNPHREFLLLPNAQPTDAGEYEARAINPAGQASVVIQVAVYEGINEAVAVKSATPLKLITQSWGPGRVSWSVVDNPDLYSGRNSPFLTLLTPAAGVNNRLYGDGVRSPTATLRLGTESKVIAVYWLENRLPPRILRVPFGNYAVGDSPGGMVLTEYLPELPIGISATGLPAGMSIDPETGGLNGSFTKAGTYTVTWRATNEAGKDAVTSVFRVSSSAKRIPQAGAYAGLIGETVITDEPAPPSAYAFVKATGAGAFSGQFRYQGLVRRFSGVFDPAGTYPDASEAGVSLGTLSPDVRDAYLFLVYDDGYSAEGFRVTLYYDQADGERVTVEGWLPQVARPSLHELHMYTGSFAGLLSPVPGSTQVSNMGTGVSSLSISPDGTSVKAAATLGDGSTYTFSSALPYRQSTVIPELPVHGYDGVSKSSLFGWMPLGTSSYLRWTRPANAKSRVYPDGFQTMVSSRFIKRRALAAGQLLLPDVAAGPLNARLTASWNGSDVIDAAFNLTTAHRAVFPGPNNQGASLQFYAATGTFTGSFKTPGAGTAMRAVSFRGMMLPGMNTGGGFFLLPELPDADAEPPTTSATAPILSGRVVITPNTPNQ